MSKDSKCLILNYKKIVILPSQNAANKFKKICPSLVGGFSPELSPMKS